jgi:hypothetical protein
MLNEKSIIVKIWGGVGNQMFQYAAAKALALQTGRELVIDILHFNRVHLNETPRQYKLNIFPAIKEVTALKKDVNNIVPQFRSPLLSRVYRNINKSIFNFNKSYRVDKSSFYSEISVNQSHVTYLDGYWQSEKYFQAMSEEIRELFSLNYLDADPSLTENIEAIRSANSASIHVRRGDYIASPHSKQIHAICDPKYYEKAIDIVGKAASDGLTLFIFSDDIEWCRANLRIQFPHKFIVTTQDYHDLYLMSICNHNIIANSSFSWWAAWLNMNEDKLIVAPKKWFLNADSGDIIPNSWTTI